jgi:type I restriction enzyme, S subunit
MSDQLTEEQNLFSIHDFLGNESLFCDGDWVESKDQDEEGTNRLIQLGDIGDGNFLDKSSRYMNDTQFSRLRCTELKEGDILIARMPDPLGRACLFPKLYQRCATVVDVAILRSPNVDVYWLMYMINSHTIRRQIESLSAGTTRTRISRKLFSNVLFLTPNTSVQKRIANILQTIDRTITHTEALIEKYQQIKAGLMHDLFTRGIGTDGKLRPSRDQAPELYQESSIGWIPKEWEVKCCSDLCTRICVGIVIQPTQYYVEDGVPAFRSANIREDGLNPDNLVYISHYSNNLLVKSQVKEGDILSVRTGYPGTSAIVTKEFTGANCIDILISTPGNQINSEYLCNWINSSFGKEQVLRQQGGMAQQHFNVGEMRQLLVALPSMPEQLFITDRLTICTNRLKAEQNTLVKLTKQKSGLMHDLLTGTVQVNIDPV